MKPSSLTEPRGFSCSARTFLEIEQKGTEATKDEQKIKCLASSLLLIRHKGHDADAALDLTQDYFARLLERGTVAAADPVKGRLRSFLLIDYTFFLADRRDRDRALKRGGGRPVLSIDARDAEGRFLREPNAAWFGRSIAPRCHESWFPAQRTSLE